MSAEYKITQKNKSVKRTLPKYLTKTELKKLIDACSNVRDKVIIQFMYNTGIRVSELINLQIQDINFENRTVFIHRGKGAKDRVVNLSQELATLLQVFIAKRTQGHLFLSNWNKPFTSRAIQKKIKNLAKKANLPNWVSPHTLRHTCAVHALQAGVNIQTIRKHLGHSEISTTQIYTEISDELVKRDLEEHNPFSLKEHNKNIQSKTKKNNNNNI